MGLRVPLLGLALLVLCCSCTSQPEESLKDAPVVRIQDVQSGVSGSALVLDSRTLLSVVHVLPQVDGRRLLVINGRQTSYYTAKRGGVIHLAQDGKTSPYEDAVNDVVEIHLDDPIVGAEHYHAFEWCEVPKPGAVVHLVVFQKEHDGYQLKVIEGVVMTPPASDILIPEQFVFVRTPGDLAYAGGSGGGVFVVSPDASDAGAPLQCIGQYLGRVPIERKGHAHEGDWAQLVRRPTQ